MKLFVHIRRVCAVRKSPREQISVYVLLLFQKTPAHIVKYFIIIQSKKER